MKVIIKNYIDVESTSIETITAKAREMVNSFDTINEMANNEDVITKLYYISPTLGKILVVVTDEDKNYLGVDSDILALTTISEYPISKLPSKIIEYKELLIKKNSNLDISSIKNAGQALIDGAMSEVMPYKIPLLKIINYRDEVASELLMPSSFGDNIFLNTDSPIVNDGDADAGVSVLNDGFIDITERFLVANANAPRLTDLVFGCNINYYNNQKVSAFPMLPSDITDLIETGDTLKMVLTLKDDSPHKKNITIELPNITHNDSLFFTVYDYTVNGNTYSITAPSASQLILDLLKDPNTANNTSQNIRKDEVESVSFYLKKANI